VYRRELKLKRSTGNCGNSWLITVYLMWWSMSLRKQIYMSYRRKSAAGREKLK